MSNFWRLRLSNDTLTFYFANQIWANICIGILSIITFKFILDNNLNLVHIAELQKCPFCYGQELCPSLQNNSIETNTSVLNRIIFLLNPKKPLRSTWNNQTVFIKKLASSAEFKDFDRLVCEKFYGHLNTTECFNKALHHLNSLSYIYESKNVSNKLTYCRGNSFSTISKMFRSRNNSKCPIDEIFKFWTLFQLNPEPLILQLLPAEEGWPVPKYYGSCGRLSIVEHCGEDLSNFVHAPLQDRMNLSLQVLDLAFNFTFSHKDFAFYFSDISPTNLVVDQHNNLKFVDLEHVIISDRRSRGDINEKGSHWDNPHFSEHIECKDCLVFSTEKICQHHISDHNFYAVCKDIFSDSTLMPGGLLHSPSECLMSTMPGLQFLLDNCIQPTGNVTRFLVVKELRSLIEKCLMQKTEPVS